MKNPPSRFFLFLLFLSSFAFSSYTWVYDSISQPAFISQGEGILCLTTTERELQCIEMQKGRQLFSYEGSSELSSPVIFGGRVFVSDSSGILAFDAGTGKENASIPLAGAERLLLQEGLLIAQYGGKAKLFNASTLEFVSELSYGKAGTERLAFSNGMLAVAKEGSLSLYSIGKNNSLIWSEPISGVWETHPKFTDGGILAGTTEPGVSLHSISDGSITWSFPLSAWPSSDFLVQENLAIFGANDNKLHALELSTGKEKWNITGKGAFQAKPAFHEGLFFSGSNGHKVHFSDMDGRELLSLDLGGDILSLSISPSGRLIAATSEGIAYSLPLKSQCSIEYPSSGQKIGRALERASGRAYAKGGVLQVLVSINDGPYRKAEGYENWSYYFNPNEILEGPFNIICRAIPEEGEEEKAVPTSITAERSDYAPLKRMQVIAPAQVYASSSFNVSALDPWGRELPSISYEWDGRRMKGQSPALLYARSPGEQALRVFSSGYSDESLRILVLERSDSSLVLPVVAVALAGSLAYVLFFRKKSQEAG